MSPRSKAAQVREPIQVYLTAEDRALLDRASKALGVPRAEVLRLGLRRVSEAATGRKNSVAAFIAEMSALPWPADMPNDIAERHDEYLALESSRGRKAPRRKR